MTVVVCEDVGGRSDGGFLQTCQLALLFRCFHFVPLIDVFTPCRVHTYSLNFAAIYPPEASTAQPVLLLSRMLQHYSFNPGESSILIFYLQSGPAPDCVRLES